MNKRKKANAKRNKEEAAAKALKEETAERNLEILSNRGVILNQDEIDPATLTTEDIHMLAEHVTQTSEAERKFLKLTGKSTLDRTNAEEIKQVVKIVLETRLKNDPEWKANLADTSECLCNSWRFALG